jgi:hypothetical protein
MLNLLNEKINIFEKNGSMTYSAPNWTVPGDLYRLGTIIYNSIEAERINANEYLYINASPLTKPTNDRPIFVANSSGYKVYGAAALTSGVSCNYIKVPTAVEWAAIAVAGRATYNAADSVNFELHASEETELVFKILQLAGLSIKELQVYQIGNQMEGQNTQQEKA